MLDYEKLYRILFNGITDALIDMEAEDYAAAKETLMRAQQDAEDYYIDADESAVTGTIPIAAFLKKI